MRNTQLISLLFFTFLSHLAHSSTTENLSNSSELSKQLETITPAKRIKTVAPNYPKELVREGAEGWVRLSYIIDETGRPRDIIVLDREGPYSFMKEARKAVKQWNFEPARNAQDEKIVACKNSVQLNFVMSNNSTVDSEFLDLLKLSFTAIKIKNLEDLSNIVAKINEFSDKNYNEWAWTHYIKAKYFILKGENEQANRALEKAFYYVERKKPVYTEPASLDILQNILNMKIEQQLYSDAKETFNKLKLFESDYAKLLQQHYQPYMTQVSELIAGTKNIRVKGSLNHDYWNHNLVRNKFSISDIEGNIDRLEVRCEYKHSKFSVKEDNAWKIPKDWGQCNIVIEGDKGTTFDIYELPEQAE